MGEGRCPTCRGGSHLDVAGDITDPSLCHAPFDQVERTRDAGQQIVEVVGEAAGELAHRFHLLSLSKLLFRSLVRGRALFHLPLQRGGELTKIRLGATPLDGDLDAVRHVAHRGRSRRLSKNELGRG